MAHEGISRRRFAAALAAGIAGSPSLVEAALQENRAASGISDDTARTLLDHIGYPVGSAEEFTRLKPMIEETLQSIEVIRKFSIPLTLEPSVVFRAEK